MELGPSSHPLPFTSSLTLEIGRSGSRAHDEPGEPEDEPEEEASPTGEDQEGSGVA